MLRPYQEQAISQLTYTRDLIYLATGSGKSVIFKSIAERFISKNKKVCFIVYGTSIVEQAANKHFSDITNSICMIMGPKKYKPHRDLYCCSVSTIARNTRLIKQLIEQCDLFIIDEAHNATSHSYSKFLNAIPESKPVIGLTATPFWVGNKGHSYWSNVIHPVSTLDLIKQGYLTMPRVFGPPENMITSGIQTTAGDYNNKQLFNANDDMNIYSNIVESWKKYALGKRTIGFGINKEHAKNLANLFTAEGFPSGYADADTPQEQRLDLVEKLEKKEIIMLWNVNIFSTGMDIPAIECALMGRPTKSTILWIQQVGRALRLYENKTEAIIIDCGGNAARLGHPLEDFEANLLDKKPPREKSRTELQTKTCPECSYLTMRAAKTCISCGYDFSASSDFIQEKEVINTDLIEYKIDEMKTWAHKYIIGDPDKETLKKINDLAKKIARNEWKKNSFFFKIEKELSNADQYIRFPRWYQDIKHTKSSSQKLGLKYKNNIHEVEVSKDTLASFSLSKDIQLK